MMRCIQGHLRFYYSHLKKNKKQKNHTDLNTTFICSQIVVHRLFVVFRIHQSPPASHFFPSKFNDGVNNSLQEILKV